MDMLATVQHVKHHSQGVQTSFYQSTPSAQILWEIQSDQGPQKVQGMREQISLMLQKNMITEVTPDSTGFYSNIFLVRKASGGLRQVIDSKQLNAHTIAPPYHMHTISSVLSTIRKEIMRSK